MEKNMSRRLNNGKFYKKTNPEQYNLLIRKIGKFCCNGRVKDKNTINTFWNELKDKLNNLGPSRNITEWKKVWNDCKRSRRRREHIRIAIRNCKDESTDDDNNDTTLYNDDHTGSNFVEDIVSLQDSTSKQSFEPEFTPHESNSMYNVYTVEQVCNQDQHTLPMEPDNEYSTNLPRLNMNLNRQHQRHEHRRFESVNFPLSYTEEFGTPPPLHEARPKNASTEEHNSLPELDNSNFLHHTLYNLQNQMDHQTKMLDNMSQISGSMALLMERQVLAIEKQTEAVCRQAVATEHHTLVMNSLVDMIKSRMFKYGNNLNRTTNSSHNK